MLEWHKSFGDAETATIGRLVKVVIYRDMAGALKWTAAGARSKAKFDTPEAAKASALHWVERELRNALAQLNGGSDAPA